MANMRLYRAHNGAAVTVAAPVKITTGTVIKTMMQLATPADLELKPVAWGISFDGSALAVPINCELIETDVAATVTAYAAADIVRLSDPAAIASRITLGVAASGFTATAEGTTTVARLLDNHLTDPAIERIYQFPLGQETRVSASKFLRVRVTAPVAVNALCWLIWGEG